MKTTIITSVLLVLSLAYCQAQNNENTTTKAKTFAEISTKTDGKWNGRKYSGGTFQNVQSMKKASEHTDHSFDIRYEGPGWESNKVGYRLYLDWRNAIDIFGKKTEAIILPLVGQDGFSSYHKMQYWGSDILKAGKGIGIGSIDRIVNKERLHFYAVDSTFVKIQNNEKESGVKINYIGWKTANDKIDFTSELSIKPNQIYTKHTIQATKEISGICTGIVKHKKTDLLKKESNNKKWAYIATYGMQSLVPDNLGLAIFYEESTVESIVETKIDHLLIFKPSTKSNSYYFLGAWEQEVNGIKTKEDFIKYLDEKLTILNEKGEL